MKKSLLLAVVFGIIAALFVFMYLNTLETTYRKGAEKVNVLVANQYIDQATMIDSSLVEVKAVPKDYLQPRAIQSAEDLADSDGRNLFMTVVPIEKGEQIITTKLYMLGMDTGISAIIPSQHRAITIVFDRGEISGIIKPGNKVDIIGLFEYEDNKGETQETAITLLQNTLVLSVGKSLLGAIKPVLKTKKDIEKAMMLESAESKVPVSFSVTPQEAELLVFASEKSIMKLSLRATGDQGVFETQGTGLKDIFTDLSSAKPGSKKKSTTSNKQLREIQKKQKEALKILQKYQKK